MKYYLSLFIFICLIKITWAEEFKLDIATDLVKATDGGILGSEIASKHKNTSEPNATMSFPKPVLPTSVAGQLESKQDMSRFKGYGVNDPVTGMLNSDRNLGFYPKQQPEQSLYANDLFDQLHDEVRLMVGEDVYAKMAWTYFDLKQLDNRIYEAMSQYDVFGNQAMPDMSSLTQPSKADSIFLGLIGSDKGVLASAQAAGSYTNLTSRESMDLTTSYIGQMSNSDFESQSKFFLILKYLTIINFLYLMLSIIGAGYLVKAYQFYKRQERQERQK